MNKLIPFFIGALLTLSVKAQKTAPDLPITWDDTSNVDYTFIDFGDDTSSFAVDPVDATNLVLQTIKYPTSATWAGVVVANDSLANPIPFALGSTTIRARIYSPAAGLPIRMKVEDETNPSISVETEVLTTVANGWDTLSFNFSNNVSGTPAIDFNQVYDKLVLFYNFGNQPTAAQTFYVDYIDMAPPGKAPVNLPIVFDDSATVDYFLIDFGGNASTLAADPNNASNVVMQLTKTTGAQIWAGTTVGPSLAQAIPFSSGNTTMEAVVYSPDANTPIRIKVEDQADPTKSVETEALTTVSNAWDTLTFDFANQASGTAPINFATTYDKLSVFADFATSGSGKVYYIDDIRFTGIANPPPAKEKMSMPITWDDTANVDYGVLDFGGNVSILAADPLDPTNLVLQSTKGSGSQVWAGTSFGASLKDTIPFSTGNTTLGAIVYSPAAGIPVRLKVEDQTNGAVSVETEALTTKANAWDTLTFDFNANVNGTPAINFSAVYDKMSIFYNFGTAGTGQIYYVDMVYFGNPPKSLIDMPVTWDDSSRVDYTALDFGGNVSLLAADPVNASNTVLQSTKTTGAQVWAGTSFGARLARPLPFSSGNTAMYAVVYSPIVGATVKLKAEDHTNGALSVETDVLTTIANTWDTLMFDFTNNSSGTPAINFGTTYDKLSIFYDFGNAGAGDIFYVDVVSFGLLTDLENRLVVNPEFSIFPNPVNDNLNINLSQIEGSVRLDIFDQNGKLVYEGSTLNGMNHRVDVSFLTEGIYFIRVQDEQSVLTKKFIKN